MPNFLTQLLKSLPFFVNQTEKRDRAQTKETGFLTLDSSLKCQEFVNKPGFCLISPLFFITSVYSESFVVH